MHNKLLYGLVGLVVILIGVNLFFLFGVNNHNGPREGHEINPQEQIAKSMHFDEAQKTELNEEFETHRRLVDKQVTRIKELKSQVYSQIKNNGQESVVDSLSNEIAVSVKEIELIFYNHFKRVKQICTPEQEVYFNEWLEQMEQRDQNGPNRQGPPRRNRQ